MVSALDAAPPVPDRGGAGRGLSARGRAASGSAAWTVKGSRDFVTRVDRTAEEIVTQVLLAAEPGDRVVGEELSPDLASDGLVWVVDPLDGTTNFLHDSPATRSPWRRPWTACSRRRS